MLVSQFNGISTPKGSYSAKTGDNDCNVNLRHYSLRTALCESIRYQVWTKCPTKPDTQGAPQGGCTHALQVAFVNGFFLMKMSANHTRTPCALSISFLKLLMVCCLMMMMTMMMMMMISKFNDTSTPKESSNAKTVVNCPMSLNRVH